MLALIGAAGWEWGKLNGYGQGIALLFGAEIVALCLLSWVLGLLDQSLSIVWIIASAAWVLGVYSLLRPTRRPVAVNPGRQPASGQP